MRIGLGTGEFFTGRAAGGELHKNHNGFCPAGPGRQGGCFMFSGTGTGRLLSDHG